MCALILLLITFSNLKPEYSKCSDIRSTLRDSLSRNLPHGWKLIETGNGFIAEKEDSIWFYSDLSLSRDQYLDTTLQWAKERGVNEILRIFIEIEDGWTKRRFSKAEAKNDSIEQILTKKMPLAKMHYSDYPWQGEDKALLKKIVRTPTYIKDGCGIIIYDNRPRVGAGCIYPKGMWKEKQAVLDILHEKVFLKKKYQVKYGYFEIR